MILLLFFDREFLWIPLHALLELLRVTSKYSWRMDLYFCVRGNKYRFTFTEEDILYRFQKYCMSVLFFLSVGGCSHIPSSSRISYLSYAEILRLALHNIPQSLLCRSIIQSGVIFATKVGCTGSPTLPIACICSNYSRCITGRPTLNVCFSLVSLTTSDAHIGSIKWLTLIYNCQISR